jgi:hypothetical protein
VSPVCDVEADLEAVDFAEPAWSWASPDVVVKVDDDRQQSGFL